MNSISEEQDFEIISLVEKLQQSPERDQRAATGGRAIFLAEAQMTLCPYP